MPVRRPRGSERHEKQLPVPMSLSPPAGSHLNGQNESTERWSELTSTRYGSVALTFRGLGSSRSTPIACSHFSRRDFIRGSASFAGLAMMAPGLVGETLPATRHRNLVTGRKLRIAHIGVGNKGYVDVMACAATGEEIVALCDVDAARGNR